jgi:hypothetical protein
MCFVTSINYLEGRDVSHIITDQSELHAKKSHTEQARTEIKFTG